MIYTRKKIEFKYDLNELEIPFNNQEITGQKYDCISLYFGYRRVIEKYTHALFFDASFRADYNNNMVVTSKGYGEATDEIRDPVSFDGLVNTHLGEKNYRWDYNNKDYTHQLTYLGKIYYPSLKLTYYIF